MNYKEKYKSFYNSKEWKRLRAMKFVQADGLCEICKMKGKINQGIDVHHIIPIEKDWNKRFDYDNLILLCKECHNEMHDRNGSDFTKFLELWQNFFE